MSQPSSLKGIPVRVECSFQQDHASGTARPASASGTPRSAAMSFDTGLYEKHRKIQPRSVSGVFANWRITMVVLTQLVFYGLPWMTWNDRQAVLFDLAARKFYVFGLLLWPQDFIFLAALMVMAAFALFLFTAMAERLWCGFACPQTVYTEIFMWIERRFEGDRTRRMKLDAAPLSLEKLWRKGSTQSAWVLLSLWTGFTFVGYFTPIHLLSAEVAALSLGPWEVFWVLFYGFATYGNAGFMREQVCKHMCPYARFQGVMFDRDTLVVTYDAERGEPRGSRSRKADPQALGLGSCVDCTLCVQVCPTGIDIRNGLQYECIGCAACIDACDGVMAKMGYSSGLIRYASVRTPRPSGAMREMLRRSLRPRTAIYAVLLFGTAAAFVTGLAARDPVRVDVIRDRNALSRPVGDRIENVYRLHFMNATEQPGRYVISVEGLPGLQVVDGGSVEVEPTGSRMLAVRVQAPADFAPSGSSRIEFVVRGLEHGVEVREPAAFLVTR
jgi:cytochrome c oxidase accessory protein FixG